MNTTNGFLLSLFRSEKPVVTEEDFYNVDTWAKADSRTAKRRFGSSFMGNMSGVRHRRRSHRRVQQRWSVRHKRSFGA